MTGCWVVQVPNPATPWTCHDTRQDAERAADGVKGAVAWFCSGVELTHDAPEAVVIEHRAANNGGVVSGVIRKLLGPQIETEAS